MINEYETYFTSYKAEVVDNMNIFFSEAARPISFVDIGDPIVISPLEATETDYLHLEAPVTPAIVITDTSTIAKLSTETPKQTTAQVNIDYLVSFTFSVRLIHIRLFCSLFLLCIY